MKFWGELLEVLHDWPGIAVTVGPVADDQDNLYRDLGRKLIWVQDSPDSLGGESLPLLEEAISRLSGGGPLFFNMLSRDDAEELSRLCDAVAAENGHTWRLTSTQIPQAQPKRGFWRRNLG
jgi:hypothetical protein